MRITIKNLVLLFTLFISMNSVSQELIQGTLKLGAAPNEVEVWLKPNFSNSTKYLFQIGLPIAFPASATPQPLSISVMLDANFIANFGNNYTVTPNPIAQNTAGTEKYFNIVMIRGGTGASNPQIWTAGVEFKVLTVTFNNPYGSPGAPVKLADYQDGGSDGQGNFYTQSGNSDYYVVPNSPDNFYSSSIATSGGGPGAGYAQTNVSIPSVCNTPSPSANTITSTGADITWTAIGGAVGYEYAVTTSATPPVSGTGILTTTYNATGLIPGTQYYAHVRTNCGSGTFSSWTTISFTTVCPAPSAPVINNITTTSADITWIAVPGVPGYEYAVTTSATPPASGTGIGTTTYNATGLIAGTQYYVHIRSVCGPGSYSVWATMGFSTQNPSCTTPAPPSVNNITATTADIGWTAVGGAIGYEYAVTTNATAPASGTATTGLTYNSTGLIPGTTYYIHVRTDCGSLFSSWVTVLFNTSCPEIGAPIVSGITSSGATITWSSPGAGTTGYEYVVTTSPTPPASGTATTGTSYSPSALLSNTQYYIHIRTACSAGNFSGWVSASFTTLCPATAAPVVNNITTTSADINWGAISGVAGYEYAVTANATPPASGTAVTGNSFSATGLSPCTQYYVHIRSDCGSGNFSVWTTVSFSTPTPDPSIPSITNITSTGADISWTAVTGVAGYEFAITTSSTPPASGTGTTATTYNATGLSVGTTYYVHIRTSCGTQYSSWGTVSFNTVCPETPTPVVSAITATGATIDWTVISGATGYQYAITTSSTPPGSGTPTTDIVYTATGLITGTVYYFHIRTACSAGIYSAWTSVQFTTICPAPTTPTVTNITSTGANISWTAVSGVTGYQYAVTTSTTPPPSGTSTTGTSYNPNNLTQGTQYYAHIRINCGNGVFSEWAVTTFTTTYPPCIAPFILSVVNNSNNTVTINWGAVGGAIGYEYVINNTSTAPFGSGTAIMETSYIATGLTSFTEYYVHVRTNCGAGGFSPWSTKPFSTFCFKPSLFVIENTPTAGTVKLGWFSVHGALNYEYAILNNAAPPGSSRAYTIDTSLSATNLKPGSKYYLHIRTHCGPTSISEWATLEFHTSGIGVYPNPARGIITITVYGLNITDELALFDASGKLMQKIRLSGNTTQIDMGRYAVGLYFIRYGMSKIYITRILNM